MELLIVQFQSPWTASSTSKTTLQFAYEKESLFKALFFNRAGLVFVSGFLLLNDIF